MIKRALWLGKPQYSSDFPASQLSPPWERQGKASQVSSPLLGRSRGRLLKSALPSLGEAGEGSSSRLSPPWEGLGGGSASQHSPPLGRGRGWVFVIFFYKTLCKTARAEKQTHYGRKYASFEPVCNALIMRML